MENKLQSRLCVEISSISHAAGREIAQKLYATDLYVYVEVAGNQIIYLPEKNAQYLIDSDKEQLQKVDMPAQAAQLQKVRQVIGEVAVEEKSGDEQGHRRLHLANVNRSVVSFDMEVETAEVEGVEHTALGKFEEFQAPLRPVSVPLKANEVVFSMKSALIFGGQAQESSSKVVAVQQLENAQQLDKYLSFSIVNS
ncbi:MAG: hypothetical protein LBF67_08405 [Prevotellaceae bacterium]|jgi:hypothetical protein|nr:hypothetical protein [Prevotellaceae bacterium]